MNKALTKDQAKTNLLWLVNTCISKGGIFTDALQVATLINSIEVASTNDEPGTAAMTAVKGTASEQLQTRINNSETS